MTRHPLDPVSLAFGAVFTALGIATLVASEVPLAWLDLGVALPVVAVVAGLWVLATTLRRGGPAADGAVPDDEDEPSAASS